MESETTTGALRSIAVISTKHLPTLDALEDECFVSAERTGDGWLCWVPPDPLGSLIAEIDTDAGAITRASLQILRVLLWAAAKGCQYLLVYDDAPVVADLPTNDGPNDPLLDLLDNAVRAADERD
jgi:hypothetical protein